MKLERKDMRCIQHDISLICQWDFISRIPRSAAFGHSCMSSQKSDTKISGQNFAPFGRMFV